MNRRIMLGALVLAVLPLAGCYDDDYGYGRPGYYSHHYPGGYGWYDGYYGRIYGGYWNRDGFYYYRIGPRDRWRRDDGRHFRRGERPDDHWQRWDRDDRRGRDRD